MKNMRYILIIALLTTMFIGCTDEEWVKEEQFVKEISIISSESSSAENRDIQDIIAFTFVDTIKYKDLEYNSDTIKYTLDTPIDVVFKVGIGGSLSNDKLEIVKLKFDQEILDKYNTVKGSNKIIPAFELLESNRSFNKTDSTITMEFEAGIDSQSLKFTFIAERSKVEEYYNFAFPLKIVEAKEFPIHKYNNSFISTGFIVDSTTIVNWGAIPIPKLPLGKYVSAQLRGNPNENIAQAGGNIIHKYITKMARNDEPELEDHYMIWGNSAWSFGQHGFHPNGWMYTRLYLNDADFGTYTNEPILSGDVNFPARTFDIQSVQKVTETTKFDPRSKTITVYYENVINADYTDVLTYVGPDWTIDRGVRDWSCSNWYEVRNNGYNYWLPIDEEGFGE